jgi:hypothetical protein
MSFDLMACRVLPMVRHTELGDEGREGVGGGELQTLLGRLGERRNIGTIATFPGKILLEGTFQLYSARPEPQRLYRILALRYEPINKRLPYPPAGREGRGLLQFMA